MRRTRKTNPQFRRHRLSSNVGLLLRTMMRRTTMRKTRKRRAWPAHRGDGRRRSRRSIPCEGDAVRQSSDRLARLVAAQAVCLVQSWLWCAKMVEVVVMVVAVARAGDVAWA